jgi:C_GCAxxG_C_C family probable redox protein
VTTLKVLGEIFSIEIQPQVFDAAIGLPGAGRFGAQCGLVEGSLMFIGIYGNTRGFEHEQIVALCNKFASTFQQRFSSLQCKDLRPQGFKPENPPHLCEGRTKKVIIFSAQFIVDEIENYNIL